MKIVCTSRVEESGINGKDVVDASNQTTFVKDKYNAWRITAEDLSRECCILESKLLGINAIVIDS